ncbi:unnamed protein product [Symbiodinium pilosum]|uniref:Uncharacterized protein n=1 Tax=Symbiodinium pilosum TaxID=2952 RepID=A0A812WBI7_SYMPI|nr:unnamed protein product [Symbiodinium pilosum]
MGEARSGSGLWLTEGGMTSWWLMEYNIEIAKQRLFKTIQNGLDNEMAGAQLLGYEVAKRMDGGTPGDNLTQAIKEFEKLLGMTMGIYSHLEMFDTGNSRFAPDKARRETTVVIQGILDTLAKHWRKALGNNLHQRDNCSFILQTLEAIHEKAESCGCSFDFQPTITRGSKRRRAMLRGSWKAWAELNAG